MVNERQAVRWGIPSQLLQRVWRVTELLGWLQPIGWLGWLQGRWRQEHRVATTLVRVRQPPLEWALVVRRWATAVERGLRHRLLPPAEVRIIHGWLEADIGVGDLPAPCGRRWSFDLAPWRVCAGVRSSLLELEEAVGLLPYVIGVRPPVLGPSGHGQLALVPLRLRIAVDEPGGWARPIRRAGPGSTLGQGAVGSGVRPPLLGWPLQRAFPGRPCRWAPRPQRRGAGAPRPRRA